jgi:hypothetical protein
VNRAQPRGAALLGLRRREIGAQRRTWSRAGTGAGTGVWGAGLMRMHARLRRPTEPAAAPASALLLTACGAGSSDRIGTSSESPREEPHEDKGSYGIDLPPLVRLDLVNTNHLFFPIKDLADRQL